MHHQTFPHNMHFKTLKSVLCEPAEGSVFEILMFCRKDKSWGMDEGRESWSRAEAGGRGSNLRGYLPGTNCVVQLVATLHAATERKHRLTSCRSLPAVRFCARAPGAVSSLTVWLSCQSVTLQQTSKWMPKQCYFQFCKESWFSLWSTFYCLKAVVRQGVQCRSLKDKRREGKFISMIYLSLFQQRQICISSTLRKCCVSDIKFKYLDILDCWIDKIIHTTYTVNGLKNIYIISHLIQLYTSRKICNGYFTRESKTFCWKTTTRSIPHCLWGLEGPGDRLIQR